MYLRNCPLPLYDVFGVCGDHLAALMLNYLGEAWQRPSPLQKVAALTALGAAAYYALNVVEKPRIVFNETSAINQRIVARMRIAKERYWPTFWFAPASRSSRALLLIRLHSHSPAPLIYYTSVLSGVRMAT